MALGTLAAGIAVVVVVAVMMVAAPSRPQKPPPPQATAVATRLAVPAIGLRCELVPVDVDGGGRLTPPAGAGVAGWFRASALPGAPGPAVVAGLVDTASGPGVFARLAEVPVGAEVDVDRSDGRTVRFVVTGVANAPPGAFPTQEVYGPTPVPELRLVAAPRPDRATVVVVAVLIG